MEPQSVEKLRQLKHLLENSIFPVLEDFITLYADSLEMPDADAISSDTSRSSNGNSFDANGALHSATQNVASMEHLSTSASAARLSIAEEDRLQKLESLHGPYENVAQVSVDAISTTGTGANSDSTSGTSSESEDSEYSESNTGIFESLILERAKLGAQERELIQGVTERVKEQELQLKTVELRGRGSDTVIATPEGSGDADSDAETVASESDLRIRNASENLSSETRDVDSNVRDPTRPILKSILETIDANVYGLEIVPDSDKFKLSESEVPGAVTEKTTEKTGSHSDS